MIQIKVNTVDITDQVSFPNINVKQQLSNTVDTATFVVKGYESGGFTPSYADDVEIYDGTDKVFGGEIVSIKESTDSLPDKKIYQIECLDYTYRLDSLLVSRTYENQTIAYIINDMITAYAPTFTSVNSTSTYIIERIVFNQIPISQALRKLADIVRYEWYVDADKDVHFFAKFAEIAPFNMEDSTYAIKSYQRNIDGSQLVNRVKVRGGVYDGSTFTDTITVIGNETKSFSLPYKFSNLAISLNGSPQDVGIDFVDTFDTKDVLYNYNDQSFHFENNLTDGDEIEYSGNPKVPVLAIAEDSPSIIAYGVKEKLIRDNTIVSNEVARRRASSELLIYAETVIDAKFSTYTAGLRAGQVITTPDGDELLIKTLTFTAHTPEDFKYSVELISTQRYDLIDLLRKIIAPDVPETGNETSEEIFAVNETVDVTDEASIVTPFAHEETVDVDDDPQLNPIDPDDLVWVYGYYAPTGFSDVKRMGVYDRGAKYG